MAEVDYGYGEELDYGYGEPDMVTENDAAPQSTMIDDDAVGANADDIDGSSTLIANAVRRGPKRRCSVTKFSLESDSGATPTLLTAASVIDAMRNATHDVVASTAVNTSSNENDRRLVTPHNSSDFSVLNISDEVEGELADHVPDVEDNGPTAETATKGKKHGVLRILSLRRK